ncbi:hypothetical protein N7476_002410 [Penicillium atrosanguineum]|uniref:Subtelomeric hrmA-associated cluster protein AFUB-079030/YDR124W-like helical bundle domain-containing protein n=1 Tax=Penicillium atrosanguineum TaxID=1132637 RepID=A0A9W9U7L5_9EURO|nr:hypothetical protein N7476_002410 [Penicillium atrosanguineum]
MVYTNHKTATGAMKRSASALEGPPGWDVAPPMMAPTRSQFRLPYAHYAMIYLDNEGKLKVDESVSIQEQSSTVFTPDVRQNFLEILGERIGYHQPVARRTLDASPRRVRRRNGPAPSVVDDQASDNDDYPQSASNDMVPLRVGDTQKVTSYYESALKHFQQLNCSTPIQRRQAGAGFPPGSTGDPEKTKPEWWPPGVMHKEPDHLRKEYRIELLLHIIRKLGGHGITADKLKEVAGDTKRSLKHPSHVEIIFEILRVRKMEERFERGEVDANMVVYVQNRGPSPKGEDEEEDSNEIPIINIPEHVEDGLLTPTSTVEQITAPLTTPIDTMPMHHGRSQPDAYSQPMLSTPVTAELISPHEVLAFDYSTQNAFPTSSPDQQRTAGHYDAWAPSFRQNIFSPVDYSAPPTSHGLPPASMAYQMPMASPAQLHDMSHHAQSPLDMSQRALPFRTGSLGHPHGLPLSHPA